MKFSPVTFYFFQTLAQERGTLRFVVGVVFSFAFSISVILCTVGLMDGFEYTLKKALKQSEGDMSLHSKRGFFDVSESMAQSFRDRGVDFSPFVQTEGFLVKEDFSKGVRVKGVEGTSFSKTSGLGISIVGNEMAIGAELAAQGGLGVGDEVVLALGQGRDGFSAFPALYGFKIKNIIDHGIYDKDMRFVYVNRQWLQSLLGLETRVNMVALNKFLPQESNLVNKIDSLASELRGELDPLVVIRPFWKEFGPLLEAIKIEKLTMAIILQMAIVLAIFNVVSFVTFLNQKKARDFFLLRSVGVSAKNLAFSWTILLVAIWFCSCLASVAFLELFKWAMLNVELFKLPGDIYTLERIEVKLSLSSYLMAFFLSLLWLLAISWPGLRRMQKKSLLSGLRLEFGR